jgi:hypothetical protein
MNSRRHSHLLRAGAVKQKKRAEAAHLGIMRTGSWTTRLFPEEVREIGSFPCPESEFELVLLRLPNFLEMTLTTQLDEAGTGVTILRLDCYR